MSRFFEIPYGFKDPISLLDRLKSEPEREWISRGERRALKLFHEMSKRVPAYKDFLKNNNINPNLVKTLKDFKKVPLLDKNNYLRVYSIEELCWDGIFDNKSWVISTNSGSTGEPFYFPRESGQDWQYAITAELYLRNNFEIHKRSTLYIDCFAMGAWIGGLFTYEAIKTVSERGNYDLSIITPGIFKDEIIKSLKNLGSKFDQVIIGGYPPFTKDVLDEAHEQGIDFTKMKVGFIFSAEGFTERFRDYVAQKVNLSNILVDNLNHYGTADLGTMAHETPLTILLRRIARGNKKTMNELFGESNRQPTLTQYIPEMFFFEEVSGGLVCSSFSGLPLVRYDLKDSGGVLSFEDAKTKLKSLEVDLMKEITKAKINKYLWNLPMVYIFERKDFVVKLYGANIFPDTIRKTLQMKKYEKQLTGKFTMAVKYDETNNQYLEINVELKHGAVSSDTLSHGLRNDIVKRLLKENSEYTSNYRSNPGRQTPNIVFWEYASQTYFRPGVKQKWVEKNS